MCIGCVPRQPWALYRHCTMHMKSLWKGKVNDYSIHDSASCMHMPHGPSGVPDSYKHSLSASLEADVCVILLCLLVALHCGCMHVRTDCAGAVVSFVFIRFGIWSGVWEYLFACNLSYLQVTLLLGGGLLTYCFSFSLHLSKLVKYTSSTYSIDTAFFPCHVSWPSCVCAADAISDDKSYFYIILFRLWHYFVLYLFLEQ